MKRLLTFCLLLGAVGMSFGNSRFYIELELFKDNLPTIAEMEYAKSITKIPGYKPQLDAMIKAVRAGHTDQYWFDLDIDTDDPIASAVLWLPNGKTMKLLREDLYYYFLERGFFTVDQLKAVFPPGRYTVEARFSDGSIESQEFELPDLSDADYPDFVDGELFENGDYLNLQFSSVPGVHNEYEVEVVTLRDDTDLWNGWPYLEHPGTLTLDFNNQVPKGLYDIDVDVSAGNMISFDPWIHLISTQNWFAFKKPLPTVPDEVTKCTVTAGKSNLGGITFSGRLSTQEEALIFSDKLWVEIACDTQPGDSILVPFSIDNGKNLKNGVFSGLAKDPNSSAVAAFKYIAKTHAFLFSLKNFDLTGLCCPIHVTIKIGDAFEANMEIGEAVVNGAKACPPILIQGKFDSLTVEKYTLTAGKQYGLDSFIASGVFTYTGTPDKDSEPFSIILGAQSFTIDGVWFTEKNGVYTCKNAHTKENWNGETVTALLDTNKCTFTIAVRNSYLTDSGSKLLKLNFFGLMLSSAEPLNLGALYSYWDLTGYDQLNRQWFYEVKSDIGNTIVTVHDNGLGKYRITEEESDGALATLFYAKDPNYDGAMRFNLLSIESNDPDAYIGMDTDLSMWFPAKMRPGHSCTSFSAVNGYMSALGYGFDIVNGTGTGKTILNPKMVTVKVPAGEFKNTVSFTQTWSLNGKLDSNGTIVGSISITCTQTDYAVPGVGVVQRVRKFAMKASARGRSISDTASVTYKLLSDM